LKKYIYICRVATMQQQLKKIIMMIQENMKVAVQYKASKSNKFVLKAVIVDRKVKGSLQGVWNILLNNKLVKSINVIDMKSYNEVKNVFSELCEDYNLQGVDESEVSIANY